MQQEKFILKKKIKNTANTRGLVLPHPSNTSLKAKCSKAVLAACDDPKTL